MMSVDRTKDEADTKLLVGQKMCRAMKFVANDLERIRFLKEIYSIPAIVPNI